MDLPEATEDRKSVLAVIPPDGVLRIVYIAYGDDTDEEDLIVPSKEIDWRRAKYQRQFTVDAGRFDALSPSADRPSPLFRKAGIYQFGILTTHDRSWPGDNQLPFRVKGGCAVQWAP